MKKYHALPKAALIAAINAHASAANTRDAHDSAVDAAAADAPGPETQNPVKTGIMSKVKSCANWLMGYVTDTIKKPVTIKTLTGFTHKIWDKIDSLHKSEAPFVLTKSNSALKNFTEQYTIDGRARYDPE